MSHIKKIVLFFGAWRIYTLCVVFLATFILPLNHEKWLGLQYSPQLPQPLWVWANFDGTTYIDIAIHGYNYPNFAYFPLLPLLIRVFDFLPIDPMLVGIILTNLFTVCALVLLYKIARLDFKKDIATHAVVFFMAFPTAFFYFTVYTDALYAFLATASFYCARKKYWLGAGILALFAGQARLIGVVLVPSLLVEWLIQNQNYFYKRKSFSLPGSCAGDFLLQGGIFCF
jgi:Gpi18-like mannosyltransferase